jgi:hypothetical protein
MSFQKIVQIVDQHFFVNLTHNFSVEIIAQNVKLLLQSSKKLPPKNKRPKTSVQKAKIGSPWRPVSNRLTVVTKLMYICGALNEIITRRVPFTDIWISIWSRLSSHSGDALI